MKAHICDVCYYGNSEGPYVKATHKIAVKSATERIALDTCEEHKNFLKGHKTISEARQKVDLLLSGRR